MPRNTYNHYWLTLIRAPGIGPHTAHKLLQHFGSIKEIFNASETQLHQAGLSGNKARTLLTPDRQRIDSDLEWLDQPEHSLITWDNERFPTLLREIPDPPLALFLRGDTDLLNHPQLAIVGSRNPTSGGARNAQEFARHLASRGLCITSGLASGIDTAAHEGALKAEGMTVAVVATGLDRVYPASNKPLAHRIAESGLLVSEFPPGTVPKAGHFPRRNRIISGLSLGTLVVEAAEKSGSLITARLASEQGREVFALPGSIHNPLSKGCHRLIRQGAKLVERADDILEELTHSLASANTQPTESNTIYSENPEKLDSDYIHLLDVIGYDPNNIEEIIQKSGLTPESVSSMLLLLELQGYVETLPGNRYCRLSTSST